MSPITGGPAGEWPTQSRVLDADPDTPTAEHIPSQLFYDLMEHIRWPDVDKWATPARVEAASQWFARLLAGEAPDA